MRSAYRGGLGIPYAAAPGEDGEGGERGKSRGLKNGRLLCHLGTYNDQNHKIIFPA